MDSNLKINHLAILVCIVLSFGLGSLWYGPLFGEPWMGMVGLDMATIEANPPGAGVWITMLVSALVPFYVLAWLFVKLDVRSGLRGAGIALLLTFALNLLARMSSNMFAQAPYELAWITGGYNMTLMTIAGFILGAWKKTKAAE